MRAMDPALEKWAAEHWVETIGAVTGLITLGYLLYDRVWSRSIPVQATLSAAHLGLMPDAVMCFLTVERPPFGKVLIEKISAPGCLLAECIMEKAPTPRSLWRAGSYGGVMRPAVSVGAIQEGHRSPSEFKFWMRPAPRSSASHDWNRIDVHVRMVWISSRSLRRTVKIPVRISS